MADWHPIRVVARRTGLSAHVIRAWERRYGAVTPKRTPTQRRVYSTEDVERLGLLRRATAGGRSIGQIAKLSKPELEALVEEDEAAARLADAEARVEDRGGQGSASRLLDACLDAAAKLDAPLLTSLLHRASTTLTRPVLLQEVVLPLMQRIGEGWREGSVRVAQEHLATAVVRSFLGNLEGAFDVPPGAPEIVVTTPSGQLHEIGALLAAAAAASDGWRVTYLGPNLPAEEIAAAVRQNGARAVALSIVYPGDDPQMAPELKRLRGLLDPDVVVIVGGRSAQSYRDAIASAGMIHGRSPDELRRELEKVRLRA